MDKVMGRAQYVGPVVRMLGVIAARSGFTIELPDELKTGGHLRKSKHLPLLLSAVNSLPDARQAIVKDEFFWVNRMSVTPEIASTMYEFVKANNVEVDDSVKAAPFQDQVTWAYVNMTPESWENLKNFTNILRTPNSDWTTMVLHGPVETLKLDSSDEALSRIRAEICKAIYAADGRGHDGYCSHYFDDETKCHFYRILLTDHLLPKTIYVKKHKFRKRNFRDTFEVAIEFNTETGEVSVSSDSTVFFNRLVARSWFVGAVGPEQAKELLITKPDIEPYVLDYLLFNSGNIPVPANSPFTSIRAVSATANRRNTAGQSITIRSRTDTDDIHEILLNSISGNHRRVEDFQIVNLQLVFTYVAENGKTRTFKCTLKKHSSNYRDAPREIREAIHTILIQTGLLDVAA